MKAGGPGRAPIRGWIPPRRPGPVTLMIGGRNLAAGGGRPGPDCRLSSWRDRTIHEMTSPPGFFLRSSPEDSSQVVSAAMAITRRLPSRRAGNPEIAIEQFDTQATGQIVMVLGDGWDELEYDPATGRLWRWTSERAAHSGSTPRRSPLTLRLQGAFEDSAATAPPHRPPRRPTDVRPTRDVPRASSRSYHSRVSRPDSQPGRDHPDSGDRSVVRAGRTQLASLQGPAPSGTVNLYV